MKRFAAAVVLVGFLCGCSGGQEDMNRVVALRQSILNSTECRFEAEVTADYGDKLFTFTMDCSADNQGSLRFAVTAPDTIAGIAGSIADVGGELNFDETSLAFPLMADDQLSPVSAPWVLMKTLRSGYLKSVGKEGALLRITIDDSYQEDALQLDIWVTEALSPVRAEILHNGFRILSVNVKDFQIL